MPWYEYICTECNHEYDDVISFKDPDTLCPKCGGKPKKKVSPSTFNTDKIKNWNK